MQYEDTSRLKLLLRISDGEVGVMISEPGPETHVSYAVEAVKDIKKFVYDNDFLLGDYGSTDIVFTTGELFLAPLSTEELHDGMAEALLPDYEADRAILSEEFGEGCVCWAVNADLFHFLSRTFACARFHHSLAVESFTAPGLYALNEADGELNIIDINADGKVAAMIRKTPAAISDCAYYILAVLKPGQTVYLASREDSEEIIDSIHKVVPDAKVLPLGLSEKLVRFREKSGAPLDLCLLASTES